MISIYQLHEQVVLDNITKNTNLSDCMFEVAANAPRALIDLQETLKPICKNPSQFNKRNTKKISKRVAKKLQDFTGIKDIKVDFYKDYMNFAVMPIYDFDEEDSSNRIVFMKEEERIKDIKDVEELSPSVTGMHLYIGIKFIKKLKLTTNEFVAILLHEVGHVFYHKSLTPKIIKNLMRLTVNVSRKITGFTALARWIYFKMNSTPTADVLQFRNILITVMIVIFLTSRTLSIFEHKEEYGCDETAARFGYGEEMSSALLKISEYTRETRNQKVSMFGKVILFLKTIFNSSTHPVTLNRVCKLSTKMLDDYSKTYPIAKTEIQKQMKNLRC